MPLRTDGPARLGHSAAVVVVLLWDAEGQLAVRPPLGGPRVWMDNRRHSMVSTGHFSNAF